MNLLIKNDKLFVAEYILLSKYQSDLNIQRYSKKVVFE